MDREIDSVTGFLTYEVIQGAIPKLVNTAQFQVNPENKSKH
jgi:hypothetical protein